MPQPGRPVRAFTTLRLPQPGHNAAQRCPLLPSSPKPPRYRGFWTTLTSPLHRRGLPRHEGPRCGRKKTPGPCFSMKIALRAVRLLSRNRSTNSISVKTGEPRFGSGGVSRCLFPTIYCFFAGKKPLRGAASHHLDFPKAFHLALRDAQQGFHRGSERWVFALRRLDFPSYIFNCPTINDWSKKTVG